MNHLDLRAILYEHLKVFETLNGFSKERYLYIRFQLSERLFGYVQ